MNIRETRDLELTKIIVHVIDKNEIKPLFSKNEISPNSLGIKVKGFIMDHIKKSVGNNDSKLAKFKDKHTKVQKHSNDILDDPDQNFIYSSQLIAQLLYNATPANATPGCIVVVLYKDLTTPELFLALIKLDKNDSILYEPNQNGDYELIHKGSTLPSPSKKTKLLKFATIRNTKDISDSEIDSKPSLIVLDKQSEEFSRFFYQTFLSAEFLLTDEHKSEKLMDGLSNFLEEGIGYDFDQRQNILSMFISRLEHGEEFNVDEAARQILSPYLNISTNTSVEPEHLIEKEIERLENSLMQEGMGDLNLVGIVTPKIVKNYLGVQKIRTQEGLFLKFPREMHEREQVKITPNPDGHGVDIVIKKVHLV